MYNFRAWRLFSRMVWNSHRHSFRKHWTGIIGFWIGVSITYVLIGSANYESQTKTEGTDLITLSVDSDTQINLVNVICGENRIPQYFTMAKSAIVFQNLSKLHFIIITEHVLAQRINEQFKTWQSATNNSFTYEIRNVSHASSEKTEFPKSYRNLKCSMERVYLPELLSNVSKVLYTDTDMVFLNDPSDIWNEFKLMNERQICGGRYNALSIKLWVNSGILLMDLEKMRNFGWPEKIAKISEDIKFTLSNGDQDLINIFFDRYPETRFLLAERFNYNPKDCHNLKGFCYNCVSRGLSIIHGWLGTFRRHPPANSKEGPFNFIYRKFAEYELGSNAYENLFKTFLDDFKKLETSVCKLSMEIYFKRTKAIVRPEEMKKKW